MGFLLDIVDIALELMDKPSELLDPIKDSEELLQLLADEKVNLPADLVEQVKMSPSDFQAFLKAKIPQVDLLLHTAGQDFLAAKILEGLSGPDVEELHAQIFSLLLSKPEEKKRFFGRIFYLINQPIN